MVWQVSLPTKPMLSPIDGQWVCSMAGAPAGTLSIYGSNYVLGSPQTGETEGKMQQVVAGKYHQRYLTVESGGLKDTLGTSFGVYIRVAGKPEALVFSLGPESGISCARP
jgi:hypothetical protein